MDRVKQFAQMKRRNFLKFAGQAGVSLPLLQASGLGAGMLLSRQAEAASEVPRKIIFIYVPDGTPLGGMKSFIPDSADTFELKVCSAPLESVKDECVFFKNVDIVGGGGHGVTQRVLGAFGSNGVGSIDLALEDTIGAASPIPSLRLGVLTGGKDPISARGWSAVTDYLDNPQSAFDRLFSGAIDTSPIGSRRDLLRLNANMEALNTIKKKLGNYEKNRLAEHLAAIEKLQKDVQNSTASEGDSGQCANTIFNINGYSLDQVKDNFTNLFNLQVDNAILALNCGMTRVVSIQIGTHQSDFGVTGLEADYHTSIHSGNYDFYASYRTYFSERIAHLIQRLKDEDDGNGGKMIDSTLLVQVTDMADGNSHTSGGPDDAATKTGGHAPFMFAGGGSAVNRRSIVSVANHHQLLDVASDYMGVQGTIGLYDGNATGTVGGILT